MGRNTIDTLKALDAQTVCISKEEIFICIDKYGKTHAEIFQKDITSIMLMEILSTMNSTIWSVYPRKSIRVSMNGAMSGKQNKQGIWSESDRSQKNGIEAQKGWQSIKKLGQLHIRNLYQCLSHARNVVGNLILEKLAIWTSIVPMPVNLVLDANLELIMSQECVPVVVSHSSSTDTATKNFAVGRVLTVVESGKASKVYDLTVEGEHEFFAGGILVHNCIDAARYALEGARRAKGNAPVVVKPTIHHINHAQGWMS
jgi:hypothetical protein